jgi:hypothetical protein
MSGATTASRVGVAAPLVALALALALAGCDAHATTMRARIAHDLACTEERTILQRRGDGPPERADLGRWEAHGCGRKATYLCNAPVEDCWREGEVRDDPTGPPVGTLLE